MFEDLDESLKNEIPRTESKKARINEFIISHNKDFSAKKEVNSSKNNLEKDKDFGKRVEALEKRGRRRGKKYSIIGILGSLLIAIIVIIVGYLIASQTGDFSHQVDENINNIPDIMTELENKIILRNAWLKCKKDSDCIETQKDCCQCHKGGTQVAINRRYFDDWHELLNSCGKEVCSEDDNCKDGQVKCIDNICNFSLVAKLNNLEEKDYYDFLNSKCLGDLCCFSSVEHMKENNYLECDKISGCPDGFNCVSNNCESFLNWCEPDNIGTSTKNIVDLDSLDSDQDGLSDEEEIFYGTDKNNPDSDGDGYLDGDEVKKSYNPLGEGKL